MVIQTDVTKMIGIEKPIFGAPMGPFYTTDLTIAVSNAGGCGCLSHTNLGGKSPIAEMKHNLEYVVEHTDKPFGFNIRTSRMQPDAPSLVKQIPRFIMNNPKLKEQVKYVITSAGSPRMLGQSKSFVKLRESGSEIKHFHVAPALWLCDKCVDSGVDGVVVTGGEGGGHQSYEKISTLVVAQQVRQKYPDLPMILCGGFATGYGLAAALAMGAGGIAMGSRFIASNESEFHETYKNIVPAAKAQDTVLVTGVLGPIRLWKNKYSLHHGLVASKEEKMAEESALTIEKLMEVNEKYELAYRGNIEDGAVLLGQSIGIINSLEDVSVIMDDIITSAEKYIKKAASVFQ